MSQQQVLHENLMLFILIGIIVGFVSRWWTLRADIRQYPTIPNGYVIHLTAGFVAAALGAVAYPALLEKNFVAVTFLALAIQQFRDIRKAEKDALISLEQDAYFPKGPSYIDGIAKTFEARNYIALISSLVTTLSAFTLRSYISSTPGVVVPACLIGFSATYALRQYTKGHTLRDIIAIEEAPLTFREENNLYVGDIYVMNIGLTATRKRILEHGIGLILKPARDNDNEKVILNHEGQRKAILHECSRLLGLERYVATRRDFKTGRVAMIMVPIVKDVNKLKEIILNIPILESNRKVTSLNTKGRPQDASE